MSTEKKNLVPQELDDLIQEYLTDGIISAKERQVLLNKAQAMGLNVDEVDLYIDAQQQKADQAVSAAMNKRRGKTCPYCGSSIPELTDKCPNCGGNITPEASKELEEIFEQLENALVAFKSGDVKTSSKNKAEVERYIRKAKLYYGNNPKVQSLLEEVEAESTEVEEKRKKNIKRIVVGIVALFVIGALIVFLQPKKISPEEQVKALSEQVVEMVNRGDLNGAKSTLSNVSVPKEFKNQGTSYIVEQYDAMYLSLINAFIKSGDLDNAEEVGSIFRSKINNDLSWEDASCYKTLKKAFKENQRDFSSLKAIYDND